MANSNTWQNYADRNKRLGWGDSNEADRLWHERERQRAEEMARQQRQHEQRQREEAERRRREEEERRRR